MFQSFSDISAANEDDDVFQCGKCKKHFTSLVAFVCHKRQPCVGNIIGLYPTTVSSECQLILDGCDPGNSSLAQSSSTTYATVTDSSMSQIVLSETEFLSLPTLDSLGLAVPIHTLDGSTSYINTSPQQVVRSIAATHPLELQNATLSTSTTVPTSVLLGKVIFSTTGESPETGLGVLCTQSDGDSGSTPTLTYSLVTQIPTTTSEENPPQLPLETNDIIEMDTVGMEIGDNVGDEKETPNQELTAKAKDRRGRMPKAKDGVKVLLKCMFCEKKFLKNFDLQQHLRSHTGEKPFQCVVCGRAFAQKSNVKKHMMTHKVWPNGLGNTLPSAPLIFAVNKATANDTVDGPREVDLLQTESGLTVEQQQTVSQTPTKQDDTGSALQPSSQSGNTDEVGVLIDNSYLCQFCSASFESFCKLKTHLKTHKNQQVYRCIMPNCGKTFPDLEEFLIHTNTHENEMNYRCHVCSKHFHTLYDLGVHQYSHTLHPNQVAKSVPRFYRCTKCMSKYSTPEALDHHLATSTHNYSCQQCGKAFSCERYLRRHILLHGSSIKNECDICHKTFKNENYMRMHLLIHSGEKPFSCKSCPAVFNRKDKLQRHSLIHLPVKKFKCPFRSYLNCPMCHQCNRTFTRRANLNEHLRKHNDDNEFKYHCQKCYMGFDEEEAMVNHTCKVPPPFSINQLPKRGTRRPFRKKRLRSDKKLGAASTDLNHPSANETMSSSVDSAAGQLPGVVLAAVSTHRRSLRQRKPKNMPDYQLTAAPSVNHKASARKNESTTCSDPSITSRTNEDLNQVEESILNL